MRFLSYLLLLVISVKNICGLNNVSSSLEQNCGITSESYGLVQGGQLSSKTQFPWITNIFTKQNLAYIYAGSGSLISKNYVLCAANSVAYDNYLENGELDPEQNYRALYGKNIRLILGAAHYKGNNEEKAVVIEFVQKVILHPSFKGTKPRIANIALLRIRRPIHFFDAVKPVCIWNSLDDNSNDINHLPLYSVGHGLDESGSITFLRKHVKMTMQNDEVCKRFYKNFSNYSGFFCAKGDGKSTACRYDKGLYVKKDGIWFLRGMSSMFKRFHNGTCSLNAPVLYEDMASFTSWIKSIVF